MEAEAIKDLEQEITRCAMTQTLFPLIVFSGRREPRDAVQLVAEELDDFDRLLVSVVLNGGTPEQIAALAREHVAQAVRRVAVWQQEQKEIWHPSDPVDEASSYWAERSLEAARDAGRA